MIEKDTRDRKKWLSREAAYCIANALASVDSIIAHWVLRHLRAEDAAELGELSKHIDKAREIALKLRDKNRE